MPNLLHTGQGSPCGITVYEGHLLPVVYRGAVLHADAGPNVVRAYIPRPGSGHPTGLMTPVSVEEATKFKHDSHATAGAGYEAVTHGRAVALGLLAALRLSSRPTDAVEEVLAPEPVRVEQVPSRRKTP